MAANCKEYWMWAVTLLASVYINLCNAQYTVDAKRLMDSLFLNRNNSEISKMFRPTLSRSEPTEVHIKMSLLKVHEVDIKIGTLVISTAFIFTWKDIRLQWDPNEFGDIAQIKVPAKDIWLPDFMPTNTNNFSNWVSDRGWVDINSTGEITWMYPAKWGMHCLWSTLQFPSDELNCTASFVSVIYSGFELNITLSDSSLDVSSYTTSSEWALKKTTMWKREYRFGTYSHQQLRASFALSRKGTYYLYALLMPVVLVSLIVAVQCFAPSGSKGRLSLAGALMVTMVLLLDAFKDDITNARGILPKMGVYYSATFGYLVLSTLSTMLVKTIGYSTPTTRPVPNILRRILITMSNILCIEAKTFDMNIEPFSLNQPDQRIESDSALQTLPHDTYELKLERQVNVVLKHVNALTIIGNLHNSRCQITKEWDVVAEVLDRILCVLFVIGFIGYTFVLLA